MTKARTTIEYNGVKYPFYKTTRGDWDFENAGFSKEGLAKGNTRDLIALTYFQFRDCAKRAGNPIEDTLEQFIDSVELDILGVWSRLKKEDEKINPPLEKKVIPSSTDREGKATPDNQPA